MPRFPLILLAALGLALAGCGDQEPDSLENVEENPQEYHDTAAAPPGPGKISPPPEITEE